MNATVVRFALVGLCVGVLGLASGCKTFSEKTAKYRGFYGSGNFDEAEKEIDRLIAKEIGIEPEEVGKGLDDTVPEIDRGNTVVFLMEKAMVRLAQDDPRTTIEILRRVRDELDTRMINSTDAFVQQLKAAVTDDTALDFTGADYENIVLRMILAISDLLVGGDDAYPYATQVGEKQEAIIGSEFGTVEGGESYKPRESYKRVGAGAYVQGMVWELGLQADEACKVYQRAEQYTPGNVVFTSASERACQGNYVSQAGDGILHVFYLGGRGPHLVEAKSGPTELALRLAGVLIAIIGNDPSVLAQAPIRVPAIFANDAGATPVRVSVAGVEATTGSILNINQVSEQQLEANMPWIIARAVVRRAIKALAGKAVGKGIEKGAGSRGWGLLASVLFNLFTTSVENADTRNWSSLPAEIQAARLELPPGTHEITFSSGASATVRVGRGTESYVVLLRPSLTSPGKVLVDEYSRPLPTAAPEEAVVPEETPITEGT